MDHGYVRQTVAVVDAGAQIGFTMALVGLTVFEFSLRFVMPFAEAADMLLGNPATRGTIKTTDFAHPLGAE